MLSRPQTATTSKIRLVSNGRFHVPSLELEKLFPSPKPSTQRIRHGCSRFDRALFCGHCLASIVSQVEICIGREGGKRDGASEDIITRTRT